MEYFHPSKIQLTKYLFFTGKGGVGKTSTACATAVTLADLGKKVLLISTDPASNLQDVFSRNLDNKGTLIPEVPGLSVINLNPIQAAEEYRESVVAPYRGKLPEIVIKNMEEQLSGSCTVEIAAFNEFSKFLTDKDAKANYDHIIFDTAPTGHTLRMLELPSAWSGFISESTHGASCLGQLSGLEGKKDTYKNAMETLKNSQLTTLILVSRPEPTPLEEAARASKELALLGITKQIMVFNGGLQEYDDEISKGYFTKQQNALLEMPNSIISFPSYMVPLRAYNITGIDNVRALLNTDNYTFAEEAINVDKFHSIHEIIDHLYRSNRKVIFTMGKGGVGKTSVAAALAIGLTKKGKKVHLTTTDPASHLQFVIKDCEGMTVSHIDEKEELKRYQNEVLEKAKGTMTEDDIAYIQEDLRSPCTQEIAVFRAFAEIVQCADDEVVVIDTAPTGHTLLLLDSTQSYHREVERTQGDIPESVKNLLPRLRSEETEAIIVSLPEATPVYEAMRLEEDLKRAKVPVGWWIMNASLYASGTSNSLLQAKASHEIHWLNTADSHKNNKFAIIPWTPLHVTGEKLLEL